MMLFKYMPFNNQSMYIITNIFQYIQSVFRYFTYSKAVTGVDLEKVGEMVELSTPSPMVVDHTLAMDNVAVTAP
jgi:hypothetical protein